MTMRTSGRRKKSAYKPVKGDLSPYTRVCASICTPSYKYKGSPPSKGADLFIFIEKKGHFHGERET
jgi:hypothetical protein